MPIVAQGVHCERAGDLLLHPGGAAGQVPRAVVVSGPTGTVGSCHTAMALCGDLLLHPPLAPRGEKLHYLCHQDVGLRKLLT